LFSGSEIELSFYGAYICEAWTDGIS
jgi:hypothetical protein